MSYIYYGEKCGINRDLVDAYAKKNSMKSVTSTEMLGKLLISKFSKVTLVIGELDTDIIAKLIANVLIRHITVITKDMSLIQKLGLKIPRLHVIDYTLETMLSYWNSPITDFENMVNLNNLNLRPVQYMTEHKAKGFMAYLDLVNEEVSGVKVSYLCVKEMDNKSSIKYTKDIIKEETKQTKNMVKGTNVMVKERANTEHRELDIAKLETITGKGKIEDYLVSNNYITKDRLKKELKDKPSYQSLELYLCDKGYYSKEDLVSILNNHLNQIVYGKEDFRKLIVEYNAVKDTLRDMGVIEAYKAEDAARENRILIIPYNADKKLIATINGTISYSSLVSTIPDYIEEYKLPT